VNEPEVVRVSAASYGIVRVTVAGTPLYLLQRNRARGAFNFLAGHVEHALDKGYFLRGMAREAIEELEAAGFGGEEIGVQALPVDLLEWDRNSTRYPGRTRYLFKIFQLFLAGDAGEVHARALRDPENAWFTLAELRAGRSASGHEVASDFPVTQVLDLLGDELLARLPESCPLPSDAVTAAAILLRTGSK
jgi:hypothetical protein